VQKHDLYFDAPGRYLIVLKEKVSQDIFEMFPGMEAWDDLVHPDGHGNHLIADIKDQSELMGLLNVLYNNRYTIMKVEYIIKSPSSI
jgi:hypothetical protein